MLISNVFMVGFPEILFHRRRLLVVYPSENLSCCCKICFADMQPYLPSASEREGRHDVSVGNIMRDIRLPKVGSINPCFRF